MGKKLNFGNTEKNFDNIQELSGAVKKITSQKKSASDYFRLDLKPTGYDLKDYVIKKAAAKSAVTGKNVSVTQYIQDLIIGDMQANKEYEPTEHEKIIAFFDSQEDETLSELKNLCQNPKRFENILMLLNQLDDKKMSELIKLCQNPKRLESLLSVLNQLDDKKIAALKQLL